MEKISVKSIWKKTLALFKGNPSLLVPFGLLAVLESAALIILYLAPRPPVSLVLSRPIRRLFGEAYLHYPMDLALLPKTFHYAQVFFSLTMWPLMAAALALLVHAVLTRPGESLSVRRIVSATASRALGTVSLAILSYVAAKAAFYAAQLAVVYSSRAAVLMDVWIPRAAWSLGALALNFLISGVMEIFLLYAIPFMVIDGKSMPQAVLASLRTVRGAFRISFLIVAVPLVFYFAVVFLLTFLPFLAHHTVPEIALWLLFLNIAVAFAVNSMIVASSVAFLTWRRKTSLPDGQSR